MTNTVYCRNCGSAIPADARYCPVCGAAQQPVAPPATSAIPEWGVIAAILCFFPVGLILMWTSTRWSTNVKLAVTSFFFPPLWSVVLGRLLWRISWPRRTKTVAAVAVTAILSLFVLRVGTPTAALWTLLICMVVGVLWVLTAPTQQEREEARDADLRRVIEADLDTCDDLILDIENELTDHPLGDDDPTFRQYVRALEMRTEGMDLLKRAMNRSDLVAAETRIDRAMDSLRTTRDHVVHTLPQKST